MAERRKRAGHLLSKHRFLALQFEAFLANDCWLRLARHANAMADRLAAGLAAVGRPPAWPVEANLVFVVLPKAVEARLKAAGARYYVRRQRQPAGGAVGAGPVPDPAGDLVCHARGRDRPIRDARRKGVTVPAAKAQFGRRSGAPIRGDARTGDDGGGNFVKRQMIYAALAVLALSAPAAAAMRYAQAWAGALPPHEILTILRSTGLDPLGQPVRRGPNYVLRAIDDTRSRGQRRGQRALRRHPVGDAGPDRVADAAAARRRHHGPYERMPPGYIPPARLARYGAGLVDDDDDVPTADDPNAPRPPGAMPGAPPRSSNAAPLPPRGGAMQPDDDDASPPSGAERHHGRSRSERHAAAAAGAFPAARGAGSRHRSPSR